MANPLLLPLEVTAWQPGTFLHLSCTDPDDADTYTLVAGAHDGEWDAVTEPGGLVVMDTLLEVTEVVRKLRQSGRVGVAYVDTLTWVFTANNMLYLPTLDDLWHGRPDKVAWPTWGSKDLYLLGWDDEIFWPNYSTLTR